MLLWYKYTQSYLFWGKNHMLEITLMYKDSTTLYTYWEFDKELQEDFDKQDFGLTWNESRLALKVINLSCNYNFILPINDLTNQWYFSVPHSNSSYRVEIGRLIGDKFIKFSESNDCYIPTACYLYKSNNKIEFNNINLM